MKVLVTGGAGFVASHIVDLLIEKGIKVVVVDNLSTGNVNNLNPSATFYNMDITDPGVEDIFLTEQPTHVIHHAAQIDVQKSLRDPVYDAKVNILGSIQLFQLCVKHRIEKVIYASSAAVYGTPEFLGINENHPINPMSFYGVSKHTPEFYLKVFNQLDGLQYTVLRYSNVYGYRQDAKGEGGVIAIFTDKILSNSSPYIFGDGEQTRDFVYVKDVARANFLALTNGDLETINISCNKHTSVNDLFYIINKIVGTTIKPIYAPARMGEIQHSYMDNKKAEEVLAWYPEYSLLDGLQEMIKYYK